MCHLSLILFAAACFLPEAHVVPSDGAAEDRFGSAVALDDFRLLVGAPLQSGSGYHAGVVYAFESVGDDWIEVQQIRPDDIAAYGEFGSAIAIDGDHAAIGWKASSEVANGAGAVVLYERLEGVWHETARVWDPEAEVGDRFGTSIDIDGDVDVLAGIGDFQRLVPSNGSPFNWAGRAVSIDGSRAVVGAYLETVGGQQAAGAAYVFLRDASGQWSQEARLVADDPVPGDYFGYSVSIDEDRVAVGSILRDSPLEDSGEVCIFERSDGDWLLQRLPPPDEGGEFGYSVVLDGDQLFVGAVYHAGAGIANGAVYHFEADGAEWAWRSKWLPLDGADDCFFGASLSSDGSTIAIGSPRENIFGLGSGAAYVKQTEAPCTGDMNDDGAVDVNDLLGVIASWGTLYDVDDLLIVIQAWGTCD